MVCLRVRNFALRPFRARAAVTHPERDVCARCVRVHRARVRVLRAALPLLARLFLRERCRLLNELAAGTHKTNHAEPTRLYHATI
jgi:hypothetical protein